MDITNPWPHLRQLYEAASEYPSLQVWLFGSALHSESPRDLDVLILYRLRQDILLLRSLHWWSEFDPPIEIIAMTPEEERYYNFINNTGAIRLC